jgi:hypothetical protein
VGALLAKLYRFPGTRTVPVIAIPLAFRRAAACAVEATNGPAVRSLTWQKLADRKIFQPNHCEVHFLGKSDWESQIRISVD